MAEEDPDPESYQNREKVVVDSNIDYQTIREAIPEDQPPTYRPPSIVQSLLPDDRSSICQPSSNVQPLLPENQSSTCQPPSKVQPLLPENQSSTCQPPSNVQPRLPEDQSKVQQLLFEDVHNVQPYLPGDHTTTSPAPSKGLLLLPDDNPRPRSSPPKDQHPLSDIQHSLLEVELQCNELDGNTQLQPSPTPALFTETDPTVRSVGSTRQYGKASAGPCSEDLHNLVAVCNAIDLDNMSTFYRTEEEKIERDKKKKKKKKKNPNSPLSVNFAKALCSVSTQRLRKVSFTNYCRETIEKEHLRTQCTQYLKSHASFETIFVGDENNAADAKMLAYIVTIHYNKPFDVKINIVSGDRAFEVVVKQLYKRRVQYLSLHQRHDHNDLIIRHFVEGPGDDKLNRQKTQLGYEISELSRSKEIKKVYFILKTAVSTCCGKLPTAIEDILNNPDSAKLVFRENLREKQAINERKQKRKDKHADNNGQTKPEETQANPGQQMKAEADQADMERHDKPDEHQANGQFSLFDECKYHGKLSIHETDPEMKEDAPQFLLGYAALALHYEAKANHNRELEFSIVTNANNALANEICKRCNEDGRVAKIYSD